MKFILEVIPIMKRMLSFILAVLILSASVSCGGSNEVSDDTTSDTQTQISSSEINEYDDELPDKTFGGRTITFGVSTASEGDIIAEEEENGDVVNDAIVKRNRAVEERFEVNIENYVVSDDLYNWYDKLATSVLAGDNICDVAGHYAYLTYKAVQKGIYQDWNTIPYIDQSKPWWRQDVNESATINGKLFGITGYLGMSLMDYTFAMFFNQKYLEDYGYKSEDLYQLVYDGNWTFDKFSEIIKNMYVDLNSDGQRDDDDFYGYATRTSTPLDIWQAAFDMPISRKSSDGKLELDVLTEKRVSALEKLNTFYTTNNGARLQTNPGYTTSWIWYEQFNFASGRQTFVPSIFLAAHELYRDMTDNYGIVPIPKWDEEQENYYANINDRYAVWGVPMTVTDTEFVGIIVEAMASETLKTVYPAYYDVALKDKFSNDEDTAKMVDIVSAGMQFDVAYMFGEYLSNAPYMFRYRIQAGSNDLASTYAESESKIKVGLEEIYKMYE